ncbi:ATP-binding cassette domain-containing protein [Aliihoeflea aestuarii]|jgi:branched-chain amino acid transport system ATP-binding protein|nr:ATP-binding cassette domain-containing protein [Aliihoeflea aestuarii]
MLEVHDLGVRYGRHIALDGVSLKVAKGEICVMLGANGAGKSSLLKAIAGMVSTMPGTKAVMNGKPITAMKAHKIVEEGIALVPEGRGIFGELTVAENLKLGAFAARARGDEAATLRRIYELFPRLAERKSQIARTMSGGEQQMVAIGRALMSKPDILMLDEPSLGLSPLLSKELFKSLKTVAATGVGILLVEQNARLSLKIADRGYLIENGLITGEDTAINLMNDPAVANAYLGGGKPDGEKRTASRGIALPPFLGLPSSLEGIARMAGDLARRAGVIGQAFVRHLRRETPAPSAFIGRYDPKAGPDPWEVAASELTQSKPVAREASSLSDQAGELARRAQERLARHVETQRLTRRHAFPVPKPRVTESAKTADGTYGMVGHNSAGYDLNDEARPRIDYSDMAARAASIQARHITGRRKTPTAFMVSPQPAVTLDDGVQPETKSPKKRKKQKET